MNALRRGNSILVSSLSAQIVRAIVVFVFSCTASLAQLQIGGNSTTNPQPDPVTLQIKKSVVFLETACLHDFQQDLAQLTPEALAKIPPDQLTVAKARLMSTLLQVQRVKASVDRLSKQEQAVLKPEALSQADLPSLLMLLGKMTNLSQNEVDKLRPEEALAIPANSVSGTGFLISVPDARLPKAPQGFTAGVSYVVTNRHVIQPGIENGKPCPVILRRSLLANRKGDTSDSLSSQVFNVGAGTHWTFSSDDGVDLAVTRFGLPWQTYDFVTVSSDLFVTDEMVKTKLVVEGDPVLFSGLFIQTFQSTHRLEPIVRSGTLAMIPRASMETVLHKPGRVFLAEVHSFGGNSGSPVFVDTNKFTNVIGAPNYKLLGVISGEVRESEDFVLRVTTSYDASIAANSDVSVVVPAAEIIRLLDDPTLKAERDTLVEQTIHTK